VHGDSLNIRRRALPAALALSFLLPAAARPAAAQSDPGSGSYPPPPFVTSVVVTGLDGREPCAGDSIRVVVAGTFPNSCYRIAGVEVQHPPCFGPCAPIVVLRVRDGRCTDRPCAQATVAWRAEARYEGLPAGEYTQAVLVYSPVCPDSLDPGFNGPATVRFRVRPDSSCAGGPRGCLVSDWRDDDPRTSCDATLDLAGRARVAMRLTTPVALKALSGQLHLSDDSLVVQSVVPIGPAAGMTLIWEPEEHGAAFVMFAASGAPIPATLAGAPAPAILEVGVGVRHGRQAPRAAYLGDRMLMGADAEGNGLKPCPIMALVVRDARICAEPAPCDANGDGRLDVRDLVTMLRCLQSACPDSARFDCNDDADFDLDDVVCCARRLLHARPVPLEPARSGAATRVEFGELERTAGGWRVPLKLTGIADLGAARLALRYPDDRFALAGLAQQPGASNWLSLHETAGGEVALALLNLATGALETPWPDRIELALELTLRDGQSPGGAVEVAAGEFSAQDGATLAVPMPREIRIPVGISLSAGRPNPFSNEARLVLGLERPGPARVTVHDLSGRRIATLHEGGLEAGQRELTWNGRDDAGDPVRDGIYFVRAAGAGTMVSQKVVRLRAR